jgi:hypothetical protein
MTKLRKFCRGGGRQACRVDSALGSILLMVVLLAGGCSCRRTAEEYDTGLRASFPNPSPSRNGGDEASPRGTAASPDSAAGRGGAGTVAEGGSGDGGESRGTGGAEEGSGNGGVAGGAGRAEAEPGEAAPNAAAPEGTATAGGSDNQPVMGNEGQETSGATEIADEAPAALPGRPAVKPRYSAADAVPIAEAALADAVAARRRNDLSAAYAAALNAYEAVHPHAKSHEPCRELAARANRLLKEVADQQGRRYKPQPVKTSFE